MFYKIDQGEVATGHRVDVKKSYTSLHTLVNDMFPPTSLVEQVTNARNFYQQMLCVEESLMVLTF